MTLEVRFLEAAVWAAYPIYSYYVAILLESLLLIFWRGLFLSLE